MNFERRGIIFSNFCPKIVNILVGKYIPLNIRVFEPYGRGV